MRASHPLTALCHLTLALLAAAPLAACDDGAEPSDPITLDAAPDPEPDWPPPSPDGVPAPLPVDRWLRAMPPFPEDPLRDRYERGDVTYPEGIRTPDGVRWFAMTPAEDGTVPDFGPADGYLVTRVTLPPGHALLGRADRAVALYTADAIQPGDVYGDGTSLFPLAARRDGGEVIVAVRAYPARGAPRVQLFTTQDALVINTADLTWPDLRVGDAETHWLGAPVIETRNQPLTELRARVIESEHWQATEETYPGMPSGAATQLGFRLAPKAPWAAPDEAIPLTLEVTARELPHPYRRTLTLTTRPAEGPYRQTFREATDGSIQYYGVNPPPAIDPGATYGLALTLHGAGVEGIGQAQAYAQKDDLYLIAPTNRRRFGFDWEAWGRLNGLAALDDALARHPIDPTRVYLTGHSMGGHGTWHLGVTAPGRFAVIGPSAGWASFETYVGLDIPDGLFGRARAHSRTLAYIDNLTRRAVYIIHGDADDNVPVREGRDMFAAVGEVTEDISYHEEPGAGHWWDNDPAPGATCVDWPPLFDLMRERRLDPFELDFHFRTPGPGYSATHSVVRLEAAITPLEDITLDARRDGDHLELTTHNARALTLDGTALAERGITTVTVDGIDARVTPDAMPFGIHGQKTAAAHGPLAQAFERPFCFVYAADEPEWRRVAAYWASYWQLVGNGHACGLTDEAFTGDEGYRAIRLGAAAEPMRLDPFDWDAGGVTVDGTHHPDTALVMVRREGPAHDGPLAAALVAAEGSAHLLLQVVPFGSTAGLPDWLVFAADGGRAVGFFDPDWRYDPALSLP